MSNTDDVKGKAKEAAADVTGNNDLKNEGKADQVRAKSKTLSTRSQTNSPASSCWHLRCPGIAHPDRPAGTRPNGRSRNGTAGP